MALPPDGWWGTGYGCWVAGVSQLGLLAGGDLDPSQQPDFSASASSLEFGFLFGESVTSDGAGAESMLKIDNETVQIVPEPPALLLLLLGGVMVTARP
jgi:hypothetical protein